MEYATDRAEREGGPAASIALASARLLWKIVRFPVVSLMVLLAPIVTAGLTVLALLAILSAVVFELSSAGAYFSFWGMIGVSVACMALICFYHFLLRLLTY